MKLYFDRLPGFIIFQNVCFSYFIHFLISFSISPVFCCVILHNSRQVLKVDRISLLIIFRLCLCVLAFAFCSGCFLSAFQTISFLSRFFFLVRRSLSLFLLCVIEWVLSFTSIFCGYCTFAEIRRHRDDNVRVSLELYTCTFISVINLSYRSFRQTSRIHFAHMHIHTWCFPFFVFVLVVFFHHSKSSLMRLKSGFPAHINVNELYRWEQNKTDWNEHKSAIDLAIFSCWRIFIQDFIRLWVCVSNV